MDGSIPVDYSERGKGGPKQVWDVNCKDHHHFKGMSYDDAFVRRLRDVRDDHNKKRGRAKADKEAFDNFCRLQPVQAFDHRGLARWEGSRAQELLREDMDDELHTSLAPIALWETRDEYEEYPLEFFRDHIHQEKRLQKYHNFLVELEQKKKDKAAGKKTKK